MRRSYTVFALTIALALAVAGCDSILNDPETASDNAVTESQVQADARGSALEGPYTFAPPVFDIDATPNGSILVPVTVFPDPEIPPEGESVTTVKEITKRGVQEVVEISTKEGSPINGLEPVGRSSFFATSGGQDQAVGAGVWHVSRGGARLVADVEAFEQANDPDAFEGPEWKAQACEENPDEGFTAGPQSNPYHLTRLSGSTALVADAAGNTLLSASKNGSLDWVAVFTPPVDENGTGSDKPEDWMVLFPLDEDADCYVQPVPTAVDIGPDGAYYVGELTGVTPADIGTGGGPTKGLSRVWRIEPGARNVTCPSDDCEVVLSSFTSVIDLEFGPDGDLFVVEYDENGWFAATTPDHPIGPAGGTINRCDVEVGTCDEVESDLTLPAAITFDKWGNLWLLENNLANPTVDQVDLP